MGAKLKLGQQVHVVCLDAQYAKQQVWISRDEAAELPLQPIHALGYVLADEPDRLTLAAHLGALSAAGVMIIPRGCIAKITRLTQVKRG